MIFMRDFKALLFRQHEGLIMMIAVYADDSADAGRKHIFTVGGFLGWPEWFFEAERRWVAVLKANSLEYFKASEAQILEGQFHPDRLQMPPRASRTFAENVRHQLGKIIAEEKLGGVAISLDMKAFRKVLAEQGDALTYFKTPDPYVYMFRRFIMQCIHALNEDWPRGAGLPLAFVFDDYSRWQEAEASYALLRSDPYIGPRLGSISHADDKKVIPLQMADLCAYESRHKVMAEIGLSPKRAEWDRMEKKHAFYLGTLIRETHLLQELEAARAADGDQRI